MIEKVVERLLGYGVPGMAFLGLLGVVWYLLREKETLRAESKEKDTKIETLLKDRLEDAKVYGDRLHKDNEDWLKLKTDLENAVTAAATQSNRRGR
jgi:hypothetical protein